MTWLYNDPDSVILVNLVRVTLAPGFSPVKVIDDRPTSEALALRFRQPGKGESGAKPAALGRANHAMQSRAV